MRRLLKPLKRIWTACNKVVAGHVGNPDHLAMLSNTGALIIWTHLPFYPLLAWWFVGRPVWPSCILLITEPLFFSVPHISRRNPTAGRAAFALFGILNSLLATKALGLSSGVAWFLLPCLLVAATFYRLSEWKISGALSIFTGLSALSLRHLRPPLHVYSSEQYANFASLNHWCVGCLCAYLVIVAARYQIKVYEPI